MEPKLGSTVMADAIRKWLSNTNQKSGKPIKFDENGKVTEESTKSALKELKKLNEDN